MKVWYSDKTTKELGPFASKDEAEHAEAAFHSEVDHTAFMMRPWMQSESRRYGNSILGN